MSKKLTSSKAKEILHDKSVYGHPLTDKQRKFFGAIAGGAKPYTAKTGRWLDKYSDNANEGYSSAPDNWVGEGYSNVGRNYSPAWGGQFEDGGILQPPMAGANQTVPMYAMGGSIPGSVGFTYARTQSPAPSEGPYAKKTMPSAQTGKRTKRPDTAVEDIIEIFDPTGISSWDDVYRSYQKSGIEGDTPMEILGAIPLLGKVGKIAKANKALAKTSRQAKSIKNFVNATKAASVTGRASDASQLIGGYAPNEIFPDAGKDIIKYEPFGPKYKNGGMTYYQHGLDWTPRNISRDGSDIPKNQNAEYIIPKYTMPRAGSESTKINRVDEADLRQMAINKQRQAQGQIKKAEPKRSAASKAWAIATHPMTALAYKAKGQDIPEHFERGPINPLEHASDVVNPAIYLKAIGKTAHNITSPKEMFYRTMNAIEGDDNMLDVVGDALLTAGIPGLAKSTLGTLDKQFSKVGQALEDIRYKGEAAGLTPHEIASQQLKKVGITSNQREAYVPGVSDLINKYVRPRNYMGAEGESKLLETINNIKKGGYTEPYTERQDAWRLYLGIPQKNKTFTLSNTSPVLHPSYPAGSLKGMDIYNIRSNKDYQLYPHYGPDDIPSDYLRNLEEPITLHRDNSVMGGYNARMTKLGTQYNDIWDLEPNVTLKSLFPKKVAENPKLENIFYKKRIVNGIETGTPRGITIPVDKFIGKPFMSHGSTPYTSYDYLGELSTQIKDEINRFAPNVNTSINGPERMAKMQQDLENVKKYSPKYKKGGVIKDDRGQWAHPGEITEIQGDTMATDGYGDIPLYVIPDKGKPRVVEANTGIHKFPGATKFTEIPLMQGGGSSKKPSTKIDTYTKDGVTYQNIGLKPKPKINYWTKKDVDPTVWKDFIKKHPGAIGIDPDRVDKNDQHLPVYASKLVPINTSKPEPTLKKKVLDVQPVQSSSTFNPQIIPLEQSQLNVGAIPEGNYMVGYTDDSGVGRDRGFLTAEQRDAFVKELEKRNLSSVQPSRGNITEYYKQPEKKSTGGWLDKYN